MIRAEEDILRDLAREEQRLAELERTCAEARTRLESLRSELVTASERPPAPPPLPLATQGATPVTPVDKVKLFRSLFRAARTSFRPGS